MLEKEKSENGGKIVGKLWKRLWKRVDKTLQQTSKCV